MSVGSDLVKANPPVLPFSVALAARPYHSVSSITLEVYTISLIAKALDLQLATLRVQFPAATLSSNNFRQVVYTHVPQQVAVV